MDTEEPTTEELVAEANEDDAEQDVTFSGEPSEDEAAEAEEQEAPAEDVESFAVMEERGKKFDQLRKHVASRVSTILGEDAAMVAECPFCSYYNMPGWVPVINHDADLQAQVLHAFNLAASSDYQKDNYARACDECNGLGETLTGSKVPGRDKIVCYRCKGNGWVPVGAERASGQTSVPNGTTASYPPAPDPDSLTFTPSGEEPPEVAALRAQGYLVAPPVHMGS